MRAGIIGYGDSGHGNGTAAAAADGVELAWYAGHNPEKAAKAAERWGVPSGTVEEMLRRDDIDCVVVTTPPGRHAEDALPFIEKGVHAMIEKPMAVSVEDCRRMIAATEKSGVKLQVTHTQRYYRPARLAREVIESGACGDVVHVLVTSYHDYFTAKRSGWQLDWALSGGGVTMNPFIHMMDLARYLSCSEVAEVHGTIGFHREGYDIEGNIEAYARMASGSTAFVQVNGYGQRNERRAEVMLSEGAILIDYAGLRLDIYKDSGLQEVLPTGRKGVEKNGVKANDGFLRQMEEMREAVENDGPISSDGYNGMKNVEIAVTILEANGVEIGKGRR